MPAGGGAIAREMTPTPHKTYGTSILPGVGAAKTMSPTPTTKEVNSYFTRGGWDLNNEPPQTRQ